MAPPGVFRFRTWDHPLVFAAAAIALSYLCRSPFAGQWDSFDYMKQIVTHRLSDLGFGRPFFLAYNIVLWEAMKKTFRLGPVEVESVAIAGNVLLSGVGVMLFHRLARRILGSSAAIATIGFLLSPLYIVYSGAVMTEVPMLVALLGAANLAWRPEAKSRLPWAAAGGAFFGFSIGIREQALFLIGAFLWMLWIQGVSIRDRVTAILGFAAAALGLILAPILPVFLADPAAYLHALQIWLQSIPMGPAQFGRNVQASLLFEFALCPAAWLAMAGSLVSGKSSRDRKAGRASWVIGILLALVFPLAALWRNADIQLHPRYTLITLPAASLLCAGIFARSRLSVRRPRSWLLLHVVVFALALAPIQWFRNIQRERKEFALRVREQIPGPAFIVAGAYSPIFDYYRAVGDRPEWEVLWSGWAWKRSDAARAMDSALARGKTVYLCDGPWAWLYFEDQRLDLHVLVQEFRQEEVSKGLHRIAPRSR